MTGMTAACTVELWLSMDADPTSTSRLLNLEYPELVRLIGASLSEHHIDV